MENMNGNLDEKNSGEERTLNDELMAKVAGGEIDEGWILNGSYVCPLCGQNHRFKFTPAYGKSFNIIDDGNHCEKIHHLFDVTSLNYDAKVGIIEMVKTDGGWVSAVFFLVGM